MRAEIPRKTHSFDFNSDFDGPIERLRIRTGLRGGRCETFRMFFSKEKYANKKMYYIDKNRQVYKIDDILH